MVEKNDLKVTDLIRTIRINVCGNQVSMQCRNRPPTNTTHIISRQPNIQELIATHQDSPDSPFVNNLNSGAAGQF